jgi:hypothetical protein
VAQDQMLTVVEVVAVQGDWLLEHYLYLLEQFIQQQ